MKKALAITLVLAIVGVAQAGTLLVSDIAGGDIRKYDSTTGAPQGLLCDVTAQGFTAPREIAVGSDGNLYVNVTQGIARYNATSGAFVDLWASTAHYTMTLNPVTNTVYTASPGAPYNVYQIVAGVESVYRTLSNPTPTGRVDHSIQALNVKDDLSEVVAYSDVSAWNVWQSTDGVTDWTTGLYMENVAATGLVRTGADGYYNGASQLRYVNGVKYAPRVYYNDGVVGGVPIDTTTTINGEVNLLNGAVHYAAGASDVRVVTSNTVGGFSILVSDPAELQQVFGVAYIPEPATMGVLALGGLALIRRKRR